MLTKQSYRKRIHLWLCLLAATYFHTHVCSVWGKYLLLLWLAVPAGWELEKTWQCFELLHMLELIQPCKCSLKLLSA